MRYNFGQGLFLLSTVWFLAACGSNAKAPVTRLATNKTHLAEVAHQNYRVRAGDTLYSIAFRYGLNYRNLAANNGIRPPYRIMPGQALSLDDTEQYYTEVIKPQTKEPVTKQPEVKKPVVKNNNNKKAIAKNSPIKKKTVTPKVTIPMTNKTKTEQKIAARYDHSSKVKGWQWPIRTTKKYQRQAKNQLLFKAKQGTAVRAAANGRVVYSGNGLVGYGQLIIIKHSQNVLSAYAFNDTILVKEKQEIKVGQKIATVGKSPTGQVGLGFEIRYQGKPLNPVKYLPK